MSFRKHLQKNAPLSLTKEQDEKMAASQNTKELNVEYFIRSDFTLLNVRSDNLKSHDKIHFNTEGSDVRFDFKGKMKDLSC